MKDLLLRAWCEGATRAYEIKTDERGATAVEYAIISSFIAAVVVAVVTVIGQKTDNNFNATSVW